MPVPGPAQSAPRAAEHRGGDGGGAGGVGDAHLADAQQVDARLHAHHAVGHGARGFLFAQRRALGEILGRLVQAHLIDAQVGIGVLAQLVDGRAAGLEVQHHLLRHFLGVGRDAEVRDAMVAGEHRHPRMIDRRRMPALPGRQPAGDLLQPGEGAGRLGQLPLALGRPGRGLLVGPGKVRQDAAKLGETGGGLGIQDWLLLGVSLRLAGSIRSTGALAAAVLHPHMGSWQSGPRSIDDMNDQTRPSRAPGATQQNASRPGWHPGQWWREFRLALGFFTRLPLKAPAGPIAEAARAFPVAGAVVGLIGSLIYLLAMEIGLSGLLAALLAVAATVIVGGALHEDGLADFADMLGVRGDRERKLGGDARQPHRLLRRAGARLLDRDQGQRPGRAWAIRWLVAGALITAHACGRATLPIIMRSLPLARANGLAVDAGKPTAAATYQGIGVALLISAFACGPGAALVSVVVGDRRRLPDLRGRAPPDRRLHR